MLPVPGAMPLAFLPFSIILRIFDQKSYPAFVEFNAPPRKCQPGVFA
jgi:hypothetical protein